MDWKTLSSLGRFKDIVIVLLRYGFDDLVDRLDIPGTQVMRKFSSIEQPMGTFERIRHACEELGPTFVKFGQILSLRPDLVPPELIEELGKLQDERAPSSRSLKQTPSLAIPKRLPDRGFTPPSIRICGTASFTPIRTLETS